jgi:hypothetical protein
MESIQSAVRRLKADLLKQAGEEEAPLLGWKMVAGSAVAARSNAVSLHDGVLRVEVEDAQWKTHLQGLVHHYLAAFEQVLPGRVKRIEFVLPARS